MIPVQFVYYSRTVDDWKWVKLIREQADGFTLIVGFVGRKGLGRTSGLSHKMITWNELVVSVGFFEANFVRFNLMFILRIH